MKKITEESLPKIMKEVFAIEKSWSKTYLALLDRVNIQIKKDTYTSIGSNLRAIFIYELIKNKLNIEDFKDTIKTILKSSKNKELQSMYSRFFNAESEVGLSKCELPRPKGRGFFFIQTIISLLGEKFSNDPRIINFLYNRFNFFVIDWFRSAAKINIILA